uniref:NADH-ubiquinone oxidoreductase chain 2 n=1 Tax=Nabis apicalis TaxID=452402 RepID=K7NBP1_9HEMI|nr:NADH dehydrogenase subunit 2 [Nabis apicalis]AEI53329.1 NADH dehydrogenase subunit 2 [Nabis apicalis]
MTCDLNLLFFTITIFSALVVISSNNWISMWMGLEMNLMAFIPYISKSKNHFMSQSSMMYFLTQSMGSLLMLFTILSSNMINNYMNIMLILSMCIKTGTPPFHSWLPEMMSKMNWMKGYTLMTLQKIAPLTIMSKTNHSVLLLMLIIMSVLIGAIGGINQTSMRKLMAYSSINHTGWMISCMYINNMSWMMYFIMYTTILAPIILWLNNNKIYYINQINSSVKNTMEKLIMSMMMLSMGGLPPFIGFYPKWMVIQYMINMQTKWIIIIMVMSSLLTLYFYIKMISSYLLMNNSTNKWMIKSIKSSNYSTLAMTLNMILPLLMYINMY